MDTCTSDSTWLTCATEDAMRVYHGPYFPMVIFACSYVCMLAGTFLMYLVGNGNKSSRWYQLNGWSRAGVLVSIFGMGLFVGVMSGVGR